MLCCTPVPWSGGPQARLCAAVDSGLGSQAQEASPSRIKMSPLTSSATGDTLTPSGKILFPHCQGEAGAPGHKESVRNRQEA